MNLIIGLRVLSAAISQTPDSLGPAEQTDGAMSDAEWSTAKTIASSDSANFSARVEGDTLFVGVRSDDLGILTFWVSEGDTVRLWHASAAIGEALYERTNDGNYRLVRNFGDWNRDAEADARRAYFEEHGWVASITPDWENRERELAVNLSRLGDDARIAVSFGGGEQFDNVLVWPMELTDDVLLGEMQRGGLPDTAQFETENWSAAGMFRVGG